MIKRKNLSEEDKKIWEDFTKSPSGVYDKEKKTIANISRKERYKFDLWYLGKSFIYSNICRRI